MTIAALSQDLLARYLGQPLIDSYDIYQHLMTYWADTMQDDCYIVASDGWKAETYRVIETDKKGKQRDKSWACDLIPKPLIVVRYFAKEQAEVDVLAAELESITARLTELDEEHGGEDGAFAALEKVNKGSVTARLREITSLFATPLSRAPAAPATAGAERKPAMHFLTASVSEPDPGDRDGKTEGDVLTEWLQLSNQEANLKKRHRDAEAILDAKVYAHYRKLTEPERNRVCISERRLSVCRLWAFVTAGQSLAAV